MSQPTEQELGARLAEQVLACSGVSSQQLQALVQDLIGSDLSLRAPLRELIQSPAFLRAQPLAGGAVNMAVRDALMAELGDVFQPELTSRLWRFLGGYLGLESGPAGQSGRSGTFSASPLTPEALRWISPQMQKRLQRIDALVSKGYSIKTALGCFPYLISPSGDTINYYSPIIKHKNTMAGFSWLAFYFPFVPCFQARVWSYFWFNGIAFTFAALVHLATGTSIDLPVGMSICVTYGVSMPYLRYLACQKYGGRQFSPATSIIAGLLLNAISIVPSILIDALAPS